MVILIAKLILKRLGGQIQNFQILEILLLELLEEGPQAQIIKLSTNMSSTEQKQEKTPEIDIEDDEFEEFAEQGNIVTFKSVCFSFVFLTFNGFESR